MIATFPIPALQLVNVFFFLLPTLLSSDLQLISKQALLKNGPPFKKLITLLRIFLRTFLSALSSVLVRGRVVGMGRPSALSVSFSSIVS